MSVNNEGRWACVRGQPSKASAMAQPSAGPLALLYVGCICIRPIFLLTYGLRPLGCKICGLRPLAFGYGPWPTANKGMACGLWPWPCDVCVV